MSTTIDERVVEMRFDNSHFERNTRETMSTLDKLKQKLNLTGASKGLENINTSANKVNMSGMSNAIDTVHSKFSALEVMGVTALANITNSAVNAGKRIVKSLTIDPVTDGWGEYEMTLNSVQTTMAGTGKTAEEVEKELKKLDEYADKTVYSTADMLNNLPKFTNAGVELEQATKAMIGIANATALAGGDAGKASIAFYNLGQAIGTGYLTRMDYNSINNAGIATMEWKNQMVEAAIAAGTLKKVGEDSYQAGNKTLTLQQLFIDGLQEQWATTDVMMKVFGDYGDETTEIGKKSYAAAQDIKTFSMMMDSLKATAGTGWKDTWQIIFGGLDEAKEFWTGLTNFISNIITRMADFRNKLLEGALTFNPFKSLTDKLDAAKKKIKGASRTLEYYQEMVNKIWRGDYKNQPVRKGLLEAEGHNFSVLQTLVNKGYQYELTLEDVTEAEKKFGISVSETTEKLEELSDEKLKELGLTDEEIALYRELEKQSKKTGKSMDEILKSMEDRDGRTLLIEAMANAGSGLVGVFKAIGEAWRDIFMPDDVSVLALKLYNAIDAFNKFSEKLRLTEKDSGELNETGLKLKRTFEGIFAAIDIILTVVGGPIKIALKLFGQLLGALGINVLDVTAGIGDAIVGFRDWLDSILDFSGVFEALAPRIKEGVGVMKEWFKSLGDSKIVKKFSEYLIKFKDAIVDWFSGLKDISGSDIIKFFKSLGESIKNIFSNINDHFNGVPGDILSGLVNGLKSGIVKVKDAIVELAKNLINKFKEILGIHSPSKVFFAIGGFIIAGLIGGLLSGGTELGNTISDIGTKISEYFKNIDWNKIFTAGISAGLIVVAKKLADIVKNISAPLEGVGTLLEETGEGVGKVLHQTSKVVKSFSKVLNAVAFEHNTEGIKNIAMSLLILVGAFAIITFLDTEKLWESVGVLFALAGILALLTFAMSKISDTSVELNKGGIQISGLKTSLLKIGLALLAVTVALKIIGSMDADQIKNSLIALGAISVLLIVLMAAMDKMTDFKGSDDIKEVGKMITKIGTAMLLLAVVAKIIGGMEWGELGRAAAFAGGFVILVGALMAISLIPGKTVDEMTNMIRKIGTTMLLLAIVAKIIGGMEWGELGRAGAFAGGFLAFVAILMAITLIPGKGIDALGGMLIKISAAMLIMTYVVKQTSSFGLKELVNGIIFAGAFLGFIAALLAITKAIPGGDIAKLSGSLLGISTAMLLLAIVVRIIGGIELGTLVKGVIGVAALGGIVAGLMYMLKLIGPEVPKLALTMLAISVAIGILAGTAILLSLVKVGALAKGIIAVGLLSVFMMGLMSATEFAKDIKGSLIVMTVAIAVMAAAVAGLSFIEPGKLWSAVGAMGVLMGLFALIENQSKHVTGSMGCLIVMTVAIAAMAGALFLVGQLPMEQSLSAAGSLAILMITLTGILFVISKMKVSIGDAVQGAVGLLALCVPLLAITAMLKSMKDTSNSMDSVAALSVLLGVMGIAIFALSKVNSVIAGAVKGAIALLALCVPLLVISKILVSMNNVENAIGSVVALSAMLGVMTGLLVVLSHINSMNISGLAVGVIALIALCIPLAVIAAVLNSMSGTSDAIANALSLSLLLAAMTGVVTVLSLLGPLAYSGIGAVLALVGVITAVGALAAGIGYLMTEYPQLKTFLDNGLPVLIQVAGGIGEMIGAFVSGALTQISAGLPEIGTNLSLFMINATPFITGAKLVDGQVLEGVGILAAAIIALTVADLINGIASILTFGTSFSTLGTELSNFIINAMPFITMSKQIDPAIMTGIKTLAEAFLIITSANLLDGITRLFNMGNSSLEVFASQLVFLGEGLNGFLTALGPIGEEQVTTAQNAANIIKTLAEASNAIPNTGGLLAELVGDNDMGAWAAQLVSVGKGVVGFITALNEGGITSEAVSTADTAANIIKTLASAASEIPNTGGLLADLVGENDLSTFASELPNVGKGIVSFIKELTEGGITSEAANTAKIAAGVIETLASAASAIPNTGGWLADLIGDNDLSTFASELPHVGEGIAGFADELGEFSDDKLSTITTAAEAIRAIAALGYIDLKDTGPKLEEFGACMISFANKLNEFMGSMSGLDSIDTAVDNVYELTDMAKTVNGIDSQALETFGESLKNFAKEGVAGFAEELGKSEPKSDAKKAIEEIIQACIDKAEKMKDDVKKAFKKIAEAAVDGLEDDSFESDAEDAGKNVVKGFVRGINNNKSLATDAGTSLGKAALQAAKDALKERSPSRAFYEVGDFAVQGFVNALHDGDRNAYSSGYTMAEMARNGLSRAISRVSDIINSDIDSQPTIRPILDLSDVESGAGYLNTMFNNGPSIGVMSNLRAISSGMNSKIQNGTNNDVVSAINKLRKDLGNTSGNTYNLNGITYDDGSNVANAISDLIRAVKMEGRV